MVAPASSDDRLVDQRVSPLLALGLLEALRSSDTPRETLEEEDVRQSLPRRLGLSRAVEEQIQRYRDMADRKVRLPASEVVDLIVLVTRRPDAGRVFFEAGGWVAERHLANRRFRTRLAAGALPSVLRVRVALRVARSLGDVLSPTGETRTEADPPTLTVASCFPALATGESSACRLVEGAFAEVLRSHGEDAGENPGGHLSHPSCEARGGERCVWTVAPG